MRVEKKLIERSGDYLLVDLTLNLSDLEIRSNRSVTYTPVIQRGDSLRRLPALIVNGRKRQILYERTGRDTATDGEFAVRRKNVPSNASTITPACLTPAGWTVPRWPW